MLTMYVVDMLTFNKDPISLGNSDWLTAFVAHSKLVAELEPDIH